MMMIILGASTGPATGPPSAGIPNMLEEEGREAVCNAAMCSEAAGDWWHARRSRDGKACTLLSTLIVTNAS
ncbi:hypothetical protein DUNSADRAFT_10010 [Dunaliella salina]|uniref:Secreted protein n=1 Tax=Dunaliella salina TaxID=3046 RepID=A0ABQ7GGA4_DUNSA|nr:hypothetical protein DUNSADRAFT_10010 [Dunaliella salina]|eukprot:KAF5833631.1 hypothetical protein DUNSADRAFT_10010 [Dunaliella salina]